MNRILIAALLCAATAASAVAQEATATAAKPLDSPLVKAAKAGGGPKKKSTKKVITNADVRKSKGKLVVLPPKEGQPVAIAAEPQKGSLERQDDERRAREGASVRMITAQKKVSELEKELRRLEDAYYAENDPNYRDSTIEQRFNQTKRQLDDARKELADARDGQQKTTGKSQ
jgi:hypothetical protein